MEISLKNLEKLSEVIILNIIIIYTKKEKFWYNYIGKK
jgi:hypothetical protein